MRIGLDLDNCGYPLAQEAREYFSRRLGVELPLESHWDSHRLHWGMSSEQYGVMLSEGIEDGALFRNAEPIPGYAEATWALMEAGHQIVIATARRDNRHTGMVTRDWLAENRVLYDQLILGAKDKTVAEADIFIDDKPEAIPALLLAGVDALYFDQPWNAHLPYKRVHTWEDFVHYVGDRNV